MLLPGGTPALLLLMCLLQDSPKPFGIQVVDEQTGRGVPLVELRTVNNIRFVTDSSGWVAFSEPGMMNQSVFFYVSSHGYEFNKDGFGFTGVRLETVPGKRAVVKMRRQNIAERLYRITGQGIDHHREHLGIKAPVPRSSINALVLGSDSVLCAEYRGSLRWFWGDTLRANYPLGNFHVPGAVSPLPGQPGTDPERGIELKYFTAPDGFAKETAKMPGMGPTWLWGLTVFREAGTERMFAGYLKIKPPMETYERGICEWNEADQRFEKKAVFPLSAPNYPTGHTFHWAKPGENEYVYFCDPFPLIRVPANSKAYCDSTQYEAFSPRPSGVLNSETTVERNSSGQAVFDWKKQTALPDLRSLKPGHGLAGLDPAERPIQLRDPQSDRIILPHAGSTFWNPFRQRWVSIFTQVMGTSMLGEIWWAEADTPVGPWVFARKIASHHNYSFYNPKQHPYFNQRGGQIVYFEGTYTSSFSGNAVSTPRYEYNQIMYKVDLDDERLRLPVAFYHTGDAARPWASAQQLKPTDQGEIAFFAGDRPSPGLIPIFRDGHRVPIRLSTMGTGTPIFFVLPVTTKKIPNTVPLGADGQTNPPASVAVIGHVWKNPMSKLTWFDASLVTSWRRADSADR